MKVQRKFTSCRFYFPSGQPKKTETQNNSRARSHSLNLDAAPQLAMQPLVLRPCYHQPGRKAILGLGKKQRAGEGHRQAHRRAKGPPPLPPRQHCLNPTFSAWLHSFPKAANGGTCLVASNGFSA